MNDRITHYPARRPGSPFSSATRVGDVYYLSGQIGNGPDGVIPDDYEAQAHFTMQNIAAALDALGLSFDDVFKCTVMLKDMSRWREFNAVYLQYLDGERLPARSAFGCAGLVGNAEMEVEVMAAARG